MGKQKEKVMENDPDNTRHVSCWGLSGPALTRIMAIEIAYMNTEAYWRPILIPRRCYFSFGNMFIGRRDPEWAKRIHSLVHKAWS